ncbi:hypothetical protein CYMTET_47536 [Cymbomonas tetramitiformis]|uniref:Uncharacterized protein n=1 Tax=Cymbomonas tetramitiformis TaxID=36881 RepID=A0AAE0BU08_9CHLO|nr:hypothetical protein CYMTET_47536 [Cymbomonas tetramitiformis]
MWVSQSEDSIFVTTQAYFTTFYRIDADAPYSSNCTALLQNAGKPCDPDTAEWVEGNGDGRCQCIAKLDLLSSNVEDLTFTFTHKFFSSSSSGALPTTIIRRKGSTENLKTLDAGWQVSASVRDLLKWAEIDLDKTANEEPNSQHLNSGSDIQGPTGEANGVYPKLRISGVELDVSLLYYNFDQNPGQKERLGGDLGDQREVVCIMEIEPVLRWASLGNNVVKLDDDGTVANKYYYGVMVKFTAGGSIGTFSVALFITAVTNLVVLLGVADTITVLIAKNAMGLKSKFFSSMISTEADFSEQYAKYAAQLLAGTMIFTLMDVDKSHQLDKIEVYRRLRRLMLQGKGSHFPKGVDCNMTMALVNFMMKETGMDEPVLLDEEQQEGATTKTNGKPITISRPEFLDAYGNGICDMHTFHDYIQRKQEHGLFGSKKEEERILREIETELKKEAGICTLNKGRGIGYGKQTASSTTPPKVVTGMKAGAEDGASEEGGKDADAETAPEPSIDTLRAPDVDGFKVVAEAPTPSKRDQLPPLSVPKEGPPTTAKGGSGNKADPNHGTRDGAFPTAKNGTRMKVAGGTFKAKTKTVSALHQPRAESKGGSSASANGGTGKKVTGGSIKTKAKAPIAQDQPKAEAPSIQQWMAQD